MIELVVVYCLADNPKSCVEKHVPMEDFSSPEACAQAGQMRAQEYLVEHPNYVLKKFRCEVDVPRQQPA